MHIRTHQSVIEEVQAEKYIQEVKIAKKSSVLNIEGHSIPKEEENHEVP